MKQESEEIIIALAVSAGIVTTGVLVWFIHRLQKLTHETEQEEKKLDDEINSCREQVQQSQTTVNMLTAQVQQQRALFEEIKDEQNKLLNRDAEASGFLTSTSHQTSNQTLSLPHVVNMSSSSFWQKPPELLQASQDISEQYASIEVGIEQLLKDQAEFLQHTESMMILK